MRNTVFKVGLFICVLLFLAAKPAHASSLDNLSLIDNPFNINQDQRDTAKLQKEAEDKEKKEKEQADQAANAQEEQAAPEPQQHVVASGETLSSVAAQYGTTWDRLFDKNTDIADPNIISVGITVVIPAPAEEIPDRPLPVATPVSLAATATSSTTSTGRRVSRPASSAGNTYAPGYCTWYAKNRRPDLPNRLGNASSWVARAAAQGFATGSTPQAGAIGQQGNHVVYVESVNGDGTVTVSDMNYAGLFVITTRTVSASSFRYIY